MIFTVEDGRSTQTYEGFGWYTSHPDAELIAVVLHEDFMEVFALDNDQLAVQELLRF